MLLKTVDDLVRRLDKDGDGYIDYLEFVRIAIRGSHNFRRQEKQKQNKSAETDVIMGRAKRRQKKSKSPKASLRNRGSRLRGGRTEAQMAARRGSQLVRTGSNA